ncbi:hypothetical protein [Parageobacillus thermoglucosidasius]|nr:hypothetical protein [Parageobacillus thermoglucosidasius]
MRGHILVDDVPVNR